MKRHIATLAALAWLAAGGAAHAQYDDAWFAFCNYAGEGPAWVAVSFPADGGWRSEGWLEVGEGECVETGWGDGRSEFYVGYAYYYAFTHSGVRWEGGHDVCINPDSMFGLIQRDWSSCPAGYALQGMEEVYFAPESDGLVTVELRPVEDGAYLPRLPGQ